MLTRAQLLQGNAALGAVLPGQVQGITAGPGLTIESNGSITINSQTTVGLMKMGQTASLAVNAYNSYNWPSIEGTAGQQLTIASTGSGISTLAWDDPDRIPWTAKGQLVVGTGLNTQTLLNVGANGTILIADSTQTSGLNYTANYVSGITAGTNVAISGSTGNVTISVVPGGAVGTITGVTAGTGLSGGGTSGNVTLTNAGVTSVTAGSNVSISGSTGDVTISVVPGGAVGTITGVTAGTGLSGGGVSGSVTLANTGVTSLATSTGLSGSSTTGSVTLTNTGVTSLIAGTNITLSGSTGNVTISASGGGGGSGTVTSVDVSGGSTGLTFSGGPVTSSGTITAGGTLALASGGTGATTQATAINNLLPAQSGNAGEYLTTDGTNALWASSGTVTSVTGTLPITVANGTTTPVIAINAATNAAAGAIEIATLAEAATGTDATRALTPESGVPKDASGMAGAALIPGGNNAARPGTPVTGMLRYNSQAGTPVSMEYYNGSAWSGFSKVAQVVYFRDTTGSVNSPNTPTLITATITPTSVSSQILVTYCANVRQTGFVTGGVYATSALFRGASNIQGGYDSGGSTVGMDNIGGVPAPQTMGIVGTTSMTILDSPATTSATTYTVYCVNFDAGTSNDYQPGGTITLMEILP
jgi:hypothetical protein